MMSVRSRISITVAAVIILVSIITGIITSYVIFNYNISASKDFGVKVVEARADELGKLLEGLRNEVTTIAKRNVIRTGDWNIIKPDLLNRAKDLNQYFEMILFADLNGDFFTSTGNAGNIKDRGYFKEIINEGKSYAISQPVVSKASGKNIVVIAAEVKNSKGEKIGLAAATLLLNTIDLIVRETKLSPKGNEWVVNGEGLIVSGSDDQNDGKALQDTDFIGLSKNFEKIKNNQNHSLEVQGINSSKDLLCFYPIPDSPDWTLIVSIPMSELTNEVLSLTLKIMLYSLGIGLMLAIVFGFLLGRTITKPILKITEKITEATENVKVASAELSASSQELAKSSSDQASFITETSATLEETSSMIKRNNETTGEALKLAEKAREASESGNTEMSEMIQSMEELKTSSDQISEIIKLINEIAFQTNILALNAAFEAERAGDAGRSFAVVADEVRDLAQKSSQASKDIENMINKNIKLSGKSAATAKKVEEALKEITNHANKFTQLMSEISEASQEQAQGVQQINEAVLHFDNITHQNAATSEESAASSRIFNDQAIHLSEIAHQLKKIVNGK